MANVTHTNKFDRSLTLTAEDTIDFTQAFIDNPVPAAIRRVVSRMCPTMTPEIEVRHGSWRSRPTWSMSCKYLTNSIKGNCYGFQVSVSYEPDETGSSYYISLRVWDSDNNKKDAEEYLPNKAKRLLNVNVKENKKSLSIRFNDNIKLIEDTVDATVTPARRKATEHFYAEDNKARMESANLQNILDIELADILPRIGEIMESHGIPKHEPRIYANACTKRADIFQAPNAVMYLELRSDGAVLTMSAWSNNDSLAGGILGIIRQELWNRGIRPNRVVPYGQMDLLYDLVDKIMGMYSKMLSAVHGQALDVSDFWVEKKPIE